MHVHSPIHPLIHSPSHPLTHTPMHTRTHSHIMVVEEIIISDAYSQPLAIFERGYGASPRVGSLMVGIDGREHIAEGWDLRSSSNSSRRRR